MSRSVHTLVRKHRERREMSLRALSAASGVSIAKLSTIESGEQDMGRLALRSIAQALSLNGREIVELVFARRRRAA